MIWEQSLFSLEKRLFIHFWSNTSRNLKILFFFHRFNFRSPITLYFIVINYSSPCRFKVFELPYLTLHSLKHPWRVVRMKHSSRRVCFHTLWRVIMRVGGCTCTKHTFSNKENNHKTRLGDFYFAKIIFGIYLGACIVVPWLNLIPNRFL